MKKKNINVSIYVVLTKKKKKKSIYVGAVMWFIIIICHSISDLSWPRSKNCILFIL